MCNTSDSDSFHDQGRYGIKRQFSTSSCWQDLLTLWCIYRSANEYQNKCFVVQKYYSLF